MDEKDRWAMVWKLELDSLRCDQYSKSAKKLLLRFGGFLDSGEKVIIGPDLCDRRSFFGFSGNIYVVL